MLQQSSILALVQLDPCSNITFAGFIGILSQHSETMSRQRIIPLANYLLFLLESLFLLKPAKHKVGEYSIIQHKKES